MTIDQSKRITVDVDTLLSEIHDNSVRVLDVRREEDYKKNHIPKAVNVPLSNILDDDSPENIIKITQKSGIDDEMPVVVYDDTFGALASRVAWTLQYIGHKEVSLLDVTYGQWNKIGLETTKNPPVFEKKQHSIKLNSSIIASSDYLETAKEEKNVVLLDNRERLNFLEQHIPGAKNIPYRTLSNQENILRKKSDMGRLFDSRGISKDSEIITYCGSVGTLSGLAYYALKSVDFPNVKLYVRSFKEWKSLEKPIQKQENANYWDLSAE